MARELGLNPRTLIKNIPSPTQQWKLPVKQWHFISVTITLNNTGYPLTPKYSCVMGVEWRAA